MVEPRITPEDIINSIINETAPPRRKSPPAQTEAVNAPLPGINSKALAEESFIKIHNYHRIKMREFFLQRGVDDLPPQTVIELILHYSTEKGDMRPLAEKYINRFGSIKGVLNAEYEELIDVAGSDEVSASLICLCRLIMRRYLRETTQKLTRISNTTALKDYCKSLFIGKSKEVLYCLYFNDRMELAGSEEIATGLGSSINVPVRDIAECVMRYKCDRIVLTHNHPGGADMPSPADRETTKIIRKSLASLSIELIDHIIVGRDGVTSMRESGFFSMY